MEVIHGLSILDISKLLACVPTSGKDRVISSKPQVKSLHIQRVESRPFHVDCVRIFTMSKTPDDLLRFPSGLNVSEAKKAAKKLKKQANITQSQALRLVAKQNGIDLPWEKSIEKLRKYWDSCFAEYIFQEEPNIELTVLIGGFSDLETATKYAKTDGRLQWRDGELWFKASGIRREGVKDGIYQTYYEGGHEYRKLDDYEVKIRVQKAETRNNLTVYPQDFDEVCIPVRNLPKFLGRPVTSFGSLAYGASKSPLVEEPHFVEKEKDDLLLGDVLGLKFRAAQFHHKIMQIKGLAGDKYHYIHTALSPKMVMLAQFLNRGNKKTSCLDLDSLPRSTYSEVHLETFDYSSCRDFDNEFKGMELYIVDLDDSLFQGYNSTSNAFIEFFRRTVQVTTTLQYMVDDFDKELTIEYHYIQSLFERALKQNPGEEVSKLMAEFNRYDQRYYEQVMACLMPFLANVQRYLSENQTVMQKDA